MLTFNVVSDGSRDLNYGVLRIQNPYNAQGFNLKELLQSPLKIPADGSLDRPPVILYYTHTSEGYCSSEEDKLIANKKSLATYDENRNVVGCGNIIEQLVESQGIGVINCNDINDENYNDAYNSSHKLVKNVAAANKSVDLSIDIHSNSFEYPAGKRYGPKVSSGDTDYAKILFVITAGDANPNWQENIKLAMLIIEKMESKVPGISLGISLRNDAKYNSVYTNKSFITEIGFEGNLVSEANATAKILGEVLGEIYG